MLGPESFLQHNQCVRKVSCSTLVPKGMVQGSARTACHWHALVSERRRWRAGVGCVVASLEIAVEPTCRKILDCKANSPTLDAPLHTPLPINAASNSSNPTLAPRSSAHFANWDLPSCAYSRSTSCLDRHPTNEMNANLH